MKKIHKRRFRKSALEDLMDLKNQKPRVVIDKLSEKMYWMIKHTEKYIMKKFNLTKEDVNYYIRYRKLK